jgi:hypothetical protein
MPNIIDETDATDAFWLDDIHILYRNNNYLKFFPSLKMTRNQQLNSITRLSAYLFILFIFFANSYNWMYLPLIAIIMIVILKKIKGGKYIGGLGSTDTLKPGDLKYSEKLSHKPDPKNPGPPDITIDKKMEESESDYSSSEEECQRPNKDNPFMNYLMSDYHNDPKKQKLPGCNVNRGSIKKEMKGEYYKDLYRNIDDLFETYNGERQFYTLPASEINNDQDKFARWLYYAKNTCRGDGKNCLKFKHRQL